MLRLTVKCFITLLCPLMLKECYNSLWNQDGQILSTTNPVGFSESFKRLYSIYQGNQLPESNYHVPLHTGWIMKINKTWNRACMRLSVIMVLRYRTGQFVWWKLITLTIVNLFAYSVTSFYCIFSFPFLEMHPHFYTNILLTGGSCLFPGMKTRL